MHDGILPPSQASVYELSGSVGPRPVPRQLTCAADLQHKRLEQVSRILTPSGRNDNRKYYMFRMFFFLELIVMEALNSD